MRFSNNEDKKREVFFLLRSKLQVLTNGLQSCLKIPIAILLSQRPRLGPDSSYAKSPLANPKMATKNHRICCTDKFCCTLVLKSKHTDSNTTHLFFYLKWKKCELIEYRYRIFVSQNKLWFLSSKIMYLLKIGDVFTENRWYRFFFGKKIEATHIPFGKKSSRKLPYVFRLRKEKDIL